MILTESERQQIKRELASVLGGQSEVRKVVVFGSFLSSPEPHDLDVAVFQDSDESYLPLATRYRRLVRSIASRIPLDVIPLRRSPVRGTFLDEINRGEVIYER